MGDTQSSLEGWVGGPTLLVLMVVCNGLTGTDSCHVLCVINGGGNWFRRVV